MNVLLVSIDSLGRHWLEPYGRRVEIPVEVPSMRRLADAGAQFERHWVGSLPCMPARREFLAGVIEFPWRPWGPLEPFDVSLAAAARAGGVRTALVTDHFHYWQYGGGGYHEDYDTWEFVRGHEYDAWRPGPLEPDGSLLRQILAPAEERRGYPNRRQYARNVHGLEREEDFFAPRVFSLAADTVRALDGGEPWFVYVDSFDVHEPFHCPEPYASMFTDEDPRDPGLVLWPEYGPASSLDERQLAFVRAQFAGKLAMVDRWLGVLLDTLDELRLWEETTVIVTSDHGHFLGEHGALGKPWVPVYDVLARTPLWLVQPDGPRGRRVEALTTAVDVYATVLDALGVPSTGGPHSRSLLPLARGETDAHRDAVLYGWFGGSVNVTDGRRTYFHPGRAGERVSAHSTSFLGTHPPDAWFRRPPLPGAAESGAFLPYTDAPVWRYDGGAWPQAERPELYDVEADPDQLDDLAGRGSPEEERLRGLLARELALLDVPHAQLERLELA
ncbi:MAG TPA: sulfatase-like hydrolase/transferase [Gaiellaceae bacterium]|nr:sulfatase-like hydrolase/transferase [Gaiellaceae bacterium]